MPRTRRWGLSPLWFAWLILVLSGCGDGGPTAPENPEGFFGTLEVDGEPANQVEVVLERDGLVERTRSGDNGRFRISGVPAGTYQLTLGDPVAGPVLWQAPDSVTIASSGGTAQNFWGLWDVRSISVSGPSIVRRGEPSSGFEAEARGPGGELLPARIHWYSSDARLLRVEDEVEGRVLPLRPGAAFVAARYRSVADSLPVEVHGVVRVRATSVQPGAFGNLWFVAETEGARDSVAVSDDGNATLEGAVDWLAADGRFFIRGPSGSADFFPTRLDAGDLFPHQIAPDTIQLSAILFPRRWRFDSGVYEGLSVPLDPNLGFAIPSPPLHGRYLTGYTTYWGQCRTTWRNPAGDRVACAPAVAWREEDLPIPVYFVHEGVQEVEWAGRSAELEIAAVSPSDSVAFWRTLRTFEERLGMEVFRPATREALLEEIGLDPDVDVVPPFSISMTVVPGMREAIGILGQGGAGQFCWWRLAELGVDLPSPRDHRFDCGLARVTGLERLDGERSRTGLHEMVHALGFGHACFLSVMGVCPLAGPYPYRSDLPTFDDGYRYLSHGTEYDVAFIRLYWAWYNLALELEPHFSLLQSVAAQLAVPASELLSMTASDDAWLHPPSPFDPPGVAYTATGVIDARTGIRLIP